MASRFLMQKLSSQMASSRSLFATHASATASARVVPLASAPLSAFVDSVGGPKRALSSDVCTRNRISKKPEWAVEWDARSAAWKARCSAWEAEMDARTADFNKFVRRQKWLWGFTCFCWISGSFLEEYSTRCGNGKSSSHGTSSCGSTKS